MVMAVSMTATAWTQGLDTDQDGWPDAVDTEVDVFNPTSGRDLRMQRRTMDILRHWHEPQTENESSCK